MYHQNYFIYILYGIDYNSTCIINVCQYVYQQGKDVVGCKDETIELKQSMARP